MLFFMLLSTFYTTGALVTYLILEACCRGDRTNLLDALLWPSSIYAMYSLED